MRTGRLVPSASGHVNVGTEPIAYASGVFDNLIVAGVPVGGGGGVPSGGIIMWSGSIAAATALAPTWYVCDGNNGTPDLRNKFIVCANADDAGTAKTTLTGAATQTGGSTTILEAQLPSHTHTISGYGGAQAAGGAYVGNSYTGQNFSTLSAGSGNPYAQPYYALAYIMKA